MTKPVESADTVLKNWGEEHAGPMDGASSQGLADLLVRIVQAQPGVTTICDLGCGNGYLASRLGGLGYRVTGVDASERLLDIAGKNYASESVSFVPGTFDDATVQAMQSIGPFDLVISSDVIEHLFVPTSVLETAFRILKPGGRLVIGTPYHGYLKNLAISALDKWDWHHSVHWPGGHIKFFSVDSLGKMVRRSGFEIDGFFFYGRFRWLWKNMICVAQKQQP